MKVNVKNIFGDKRPTGNLLVSAAESMGLKYEIVSKEDGLFSLIFNGKKHYFFNTTFGENSVFGKVLVDNKHLTSKFFRSKGYPFPVSYIFEKDEWDLIQKKFEEMKGSGIKVVIKPNDSKGGNGVFIDIKDSEQLKKCYEFIITSVEDSSQILLEEQIIAKNEYRILCLNGEIFDVLRRIPANVVGDGEKSIGQLIDLKNEMKRKNGIYEYQLIKKDGKTISMIDKIEYNLDSVPKEGEAVFLRKNCNFSEGGDVEKVNIESIPTENLLIFNKISTESRLRVCGIDLMADDICKMIDLTGGKINEVNQSPSIDIHYYSNGNNIGFVENFFKKLLV